MLILLAGVHVTVNAPIDWNALLPPLIFAVVGLIGGGLFVRFDVLHQYDVALRARRRPCAPRLCHGVRGTHLPAGTTRRRPHAGSAGPGPSRDQAGRVHGIRQRGMTLVQTTRQPEGR